MSHDDGWYQGLTWDHPRGYRALETLSAQAQAEGRIRIRWKRQPLEGFESTPLDKLSRTFDLLVIDHPHIGEAVAANALRPLTEVFDHTEIDALSLQFVGHTFDSYVLDGVPWALPLDAAAQVSVSAPEFPEKSRMPLTWDMILARPRRKPICLSLGGPHALLTLFSVLVSLGEEPDEANLSEFINPVAGSEAIKFLRELRARMPDGWDTLNPIGILDRMVDESNGMYCPLIYGYAPYSRRSGKDSEALQFHEAPLGSAGVHGSTLGGTGLAISRHTEITPALAQFVRYLAHEATQLLEFPRLDGQPAHIAAWRSPALDKETGGFYSATLNTVQTAWVRPRYPGYITFQSRASAFIRQTLRESSQPMRTVNTLNAMFAHSRATQIRSNQ